ncbi:hypothetical protein [Winogradskya consettensis]|nr:hypothetical protein [Actinoplanes consettensis]
MLLCAAVLVPATVFATTGSASAASGSLTVTTYNRQGAKVATPLVIFNVATNVRYTMTSGKTKSLAKGTYAVLASIHSTKDSSDTVGARVVKITGKTSTTIDARSGRALKFTLDKSPGGTPDVQAHLCAADSSMGVDAYNTAGKVFVIPNGSKHLHSSFSTTWQSFSNEQWVIGTSHTTIPTSLTRTVKRSSLATLTSVVKKGVAGGAETNIALQGEGSTGSCRDSMYIGLNQAEAPFTMKTHFSGGKWLVRTESIATEQGNFVGIGNQWVTKTFTGGKSYSQTNFRSAWGPGIHRPEVTTGNRIGFSTDAMFTDPGFGWQNLDGWEASQKSTVWLYKGSKLIKKQTRSNWGDADSGFQAKVPSAGWYRLKVSAQRYRPGIKYPSDLLSNKAGVWFSFYANPKKEDTAIPVSLPRLSPAGLDMTNRAKPRSTTTVNIKTQGTAAKSMTAKASFDGGKTWKSVPVRKTGTTWAATVKNPAAGTIALRAQAKTSKGYTTEVTIYRAYRIN